MCKSGKEKTEAITMEQSSKAARLECKRVQRIRNRSSYLLFQQIYNFLKSKPDIADILRKFYDVLDGRCSFGSRRNAEYAAESLDWVLKDKGVNSRSQLYKGSSSSTEQPGGTLSPDGG